MEKSIWHFRGVKITFEANTKEQLTLEQISELCSSLVAAVEKNDFVQTVLD